MTKVTYKNIVILTGAGISAESGIKTFRASDGLWEEHRIEDVATPEAFIRDPKLVQRFYNLRREQLLAQVNNEQKIKPNAAHYALANLEQEFAGNFTLITQNIDNLHEQAGSKNIFHMHGELLKMHCNKSKQVYSCEKNLSIEDKCECCNESGNLRPHIVWFGEMPMFMDEIMLQLNDCDLFVAIGTSGNVYPAAGFVEVASQNGADSLEINLEESMTANSFARGIYAPATEAVSGWVNSIIK